VGDVRVLATRAVDPEHIAAVCSAARARFAEWVRAHGGAEVESPPVNVVIAPAAILCAQELQKKLSPAECGARPPHFAYPPRRSTLYVLDDERLESVNLVEAVSAHVCINTPALLEKRCMLNFLPPYWDEVERARE
jgi:hypothetical protein